MMADLQEYPRIVPRPSQGLPGQIVMVFNGTHVGTATIPNAGHRDITIDTVTFGESSSVPNLADDGTVVGFTVPRTGTYIIETSVSFSGWTEDGTKYYQSRWGKNGVAQTWHFGGNPLGGHQAILFVSEKLTKDDTITLTTYHTYGSNKDINVAGLTIYEVVN